MYISLGVFSFIAGFIDCRKAQEESNLEALGLGLQYLTVPGRRTAISQPHGGALHPNHYGNSETTKLHFLVGPISQGTFNAVACDNRNFRSHACLSVPFMPYQSVGQAFVF
jgi:hypothetical protein